MRGRLWRWLVRKSQAVLRSGCAECSGTEVLFRCVDSSYAKRQRKLDLTFTVNTDKYQLNTLEKVDGAAITVTPPEPAAAWTAAAGR